MIGSVNVFLAFIKRDPHDLVSALSVKETQFGKRAVSKLLKSLLEFLRNCEGELCI